MIFDLLVPGMQHAEEADLGAEMVRVARDFEKSFRAATKQQVVDNFLVLQCERRQFMWEREDYMPVARRAELWAGRVGPPVAGASGGAVGAQQSDRGTA